MPVFTRFEHGSRWDQPAGDDGVARAESTAWKGPVRGDKALWVGGGNVVAQV